MGKFYKNLAHFAGFSFAFFAVKNNAKLNRKEHKVFRKERKGLFLQKMNNKYYSKEEALQKAKQYCAYQERSHSEVKEKLYSFGLYKKDVDELLSELISENYLNEERFAIMFAGGKFRIKQWGRIKIKYALKQKQVSEYCIKKHWQPLMKMITIKLWGNCLNKN